MTLVIDASVALRWLAQGGGSAEVDALFDNASGLGGDELLISPALILLEVHNALAKLWNRQIVNRPLLAEGAVRLSIALQIETVDAELAVKASALSLTAEIAMGRKVTARMVPFSIYDCLYIALALRWSAQLVTADERQADVAAALGCPVRRIA
jgi:predicted nucleic acid-binding protein